MHFDGANHRAGREPSFWAVIAIGLREGLVLETETSKRHQR